MNCLLVVTGGRNFRGISTGANFLIRYHIKGLRCDLCCNGVIGPISASYALGPPLSPLPPEPPTHQNKRTNLLLMVLHTCSHLFVRCTPQGGTIIFDLPSFPPALIDCVSCAITSPMLIQSLISTSWPIPPSLQLSRN